MSKTFRSGASRENEKTRYLQNNIIWKSYPSYLNYHTIMFCLSQSPVLNRFISIAVKKAVSFLCCWSQLL